MARTNLLPKWLQAELAKPRPPTPVPVHAPIARGDIRICEGTAERHHVLVLDVYERHVSIALLTNDVDMAADCTPILSRSMTGLPYSLLALNLVGPVFPTQLGERLAHLADHSTVIRRMVMGDISAFVEHPCIKRGMPFSGPSSWRWKAHEDALRDLQSLCYEAMQVLLGEE